MTEEKPTTLKDIDNSIGCGCLVILFTMVLLVISITKSLNEIRDVIKAQAQCTEAK